MKDNRTELQKRFEEVTPTIRDVDEKEYLQAYCTWLETKLETKAEGVIKVGGKIIGGLKEVTLPQSTIKQEEKDKRMIKIRLDSAKKKNLENEVVYEALKIMQASPGLTISDVIIIAHSEWIK